MDVAAQRKSLDNDYGATKGANAPASHQVALFYGDPRIPEASGGGTEVEDETEVDDGAGGTVLVPNGYARVTLANNGTTWAAADTGGLKSTNAGVYSPPDALAEYPTPVTHFCLIDAADGITRWDSGELSEPLVVTAAGPVGSIPLTVYYADSVEDPA